MHELRLETTRKTELVDVRDGELALGPLQTLFFCEFDGPRTRSLYVTVL